MGEERSYVVGFMLDRARQNVVLIRKNRPAWQAGFLNGVGGKIEPGETPLDAMVREFHEETGHFTAPIQWNSMCTITWPDDWERVADTKGASVSFFRLVRHDDTPLDRLVRTCTDELIEVRRVAALGLEEVTPNLRWLVPLAAYTADRYDPFTIRATVAEIHPAVTNG